MTIATIPQVFYEFAFNADPGQSVLPPYWQDLSSRVLWPWDTMRGRQYELDTNETGEWHPRLDNRDGALDPGNTASPFYPNVLLYRQGRIRVVLGNNLLLPDQASAGDWSGLPAGPCSPPVGVTGFNGAPGTIAVIGGSAFAGSRTWTTTVPSGTPGADLLTVAVPQVTAGTGYTFSAQVQATTTGQSPACYLAVNWLAANGTVAATAFGSPSTLTGGSGTWTGLTVSGTAPTGAVAAALRVVTSTTPSANSTIWTDGLQLETRGYATRWQMPYQTGVNLLPQNIATGLETMNPVTGSATAWFTVTGPSSASPARVTNLTAAPTGGTTAVSWAMPSGSTTGATFYAGAGTTPGPVADCVQVTAGLAYSASVYLTRTGPDATVTITAKLVWYNSAGVSLGAVTGSAATVPTSGWVRATVANKVAPAGAVWARFSLSVTTPGTFTGAETVYATGWQVEQATAVSTWADPGLASFIFTGFDERLPQDFTELGRTVGTVDAIVQDVFGTLATGQLLDPFVNELLALDPNFLYELNEPAGATSCTDSTGNRIPAPVETSPYGAGSLTFGSSITAASQPSGLFTGTSGPVATFNNDQTYGLTAQRPETFISLHKTTATPGPPAAGNFTRLIHFRAPAPPTAGNFFEFWSALPQSYAGTGPSSAFQFGVNGTSGQAAFTLVGAASTTVQYVFLGANLCDGNWHQAALACDGSGNVTMYVDGAAVVPSGSTAVTLPLAGITSDVIGASVQLGAGYYRSGTVGDIALAVEIPSVLSAAQIANLYNSWRNASTGESSGARYARVLSWVGYSGATAIDTGQTQSMGPATDITGQTPLDALNSIALTENGDHYASSAGVLTFKSRAARYNQRTPAFVFGESAPIGSYGEWPCEIARIEYDPSHLANTVQVTQWAGSTYSARDTTSATRYLPRTYLRQINVSSATEAQSAATYLLGQLKDPHSRPEAIVLHPSAVPGLMAVCVALEKGVRIRLIKRPPGGTLIIVDCFVERIEWQWDPDSGDVWVTVQASPADLTSYGVLGALHTTLNAQANAASNTCVIKALPDAAYNKLAQSLPWSSQLRFEPGTPRDETLTLSPTGIPSTSLGYTTATLTFTSNFAFTHPANSTVCEPLPTGYTDPTTWDASAVIGAVTTTVLSGGASGTNTVTVNPLADAAYNSLSATWNGGDQITLSPNTPNAETVTIQSVAVTYPGYPSCQITVTANFTKTHAAGDTVCDPLPAGIATPSAITPTLRLSY